MRRALAISLLAHAWLLALGWPQAVPPREAGALQATLRPVLSALPAGQAAAEARAAPAARQEAPVVAPRAAATATARASHATPMASLAPAPPLGLHAASTPPAPDRSPVEEGSGRNAPVGPGGQGGQGGEGADADGLRQYRLALAREARRYKRYPERALLAGVGGTAEIRVEHAAGAIPVARLARSSGDDTLDAAALVMMREAAPRTVVPETLRGRSFAVSLPVIFDASAE